MRRASNGVAWPHRRAGDFGSAWDDLSGTCRSARQRLAERSQWSLASEFLVVGGQNF